MYDLEVDAEPCMDYIRGPSPIVWVSMMYSGFLVSIPRLPPILEAVSYHSSVLRPRVPMSTRERRLTTQLSNHREPP